LHRVDGESFAVDHHCKRVAAVGPVGEHVELREASSHAVVPAPAIAELP
jgi:hypothetical protein